jgi:hypothetical protein
MSDICFLSLYGKRRIAAKTYSGTFIMCSMQVKVERTQKNRGVLNEFSIYDYMQMTEYFYLLLKTEE